MVIVSGGVQQLALMSTPLNSVIIELCSLRHPMDVVRKLSIAARVFILG